MPICILVTPYLKHLSNCSGVIWSGRVSIVIPTILQRAVSFMFFSSSKDFIGLGFSL